jgi:hypothetical protein
LSFFNTPSQGIDWLEPVPGGSNWNTESSYTLGSLSTGRTLLHEPTAALNATSYIFDGIDSSSATLNISNTSATAHNLLVIYGGFDFVPGMNLDLTSFGNAFEFTHTSADLPNSATVTISIDSNGTGYSSAPITLTGSNPMGPAMTTTYSIPFSSFAGANFSDVDSISFRVNTSAGANLSISNLQVVPEPSGAMLLSLVTGACVLRRRRR